MREYLKTPEMKKKHAAYMKKNHDVLSENRKRWRRENPIRAAWLGLKNRADRIPGVTMSLTWERFQVLMSVEKCPICGVVMKDKGKHGRHDWGMKSVDRISAGGDYSEENCACICKRCNQIKNDGSAAEHENIARWMRRQVMSEFVDREIEDMVKDGELVIDPFLPESLNPSSYDLSLGPWFWRHVDGELRLFDARDVGGVALAPMESVLAHTNEVLGGWSTINTQIYATTTAGRNDITVCRDAGIGDPGFVGIWCFQLQNLGPSPVTLKVNTVIAKAVFRPTAKPKNAYSGQYGRGPRRSADEIRDEWNPRHMLPKAMKVREMPEDLWK